MSENKTAPRVHRASFVDMISPTDLQDRAWREFKTRWPLYTFLVALLILALLRVTLTNYGAVLQLFGVEGADPWFGKAADIGGIDMERLVVLPNHQIAVNNGFRVINETSAYRESLRTLAALPLLDWGLLFKPQYWMFFTGADPAFAYAFGEWLLIASFIVGNFYLFRFIGASPVVATSLSVAFFYSPFLQIWWHTFAIIFAVLPWVLLASVSRQVSWAKSSIAVMFGVVVMLIGNFYPPIIIGLCIVSAGFYVAFASRDGWLVRGAAVGVGAIAGAAISYLYLADALHAVGGASYPGIRIMSGNDGFPFGSWISQFIPTYISIDNRSAVGNELAEVSGGGSFFFLACAVFADGSALTEEDRKRLRFVLICMGVPLAILWAWMLAPLPSWAGVPFLLHLATPRRLLLASVFALCIVAAYVSGRVRLHFSLSRVALYAFLVSIAWLGHKVTANGMAIKSWASVVDLAPAIAALAAFALTAWRPRAGTATIAVVAAAVNLVAFGGYYTLQPIDKAFHRPETVLTKTLDVVAAKNPEGFVAVPGEAFSGAVLNGWGYRSLSHMINIPDAPAIAKFTPWLSADKVQAYLNRQAIIRLEAVPDIPEPGGIGLTLPFERMPVNLQLRKVELSRPPGPINQGGDGGDATITVSGKSVEVRGWGRWYGYDVAQALYVTSSIPVAKVSMNYGAGPPTAHFALSGFILHIELAQPAADAAAVDLCVWASDPNPDYGTRLLNGSWPSCSASF